MNGNAPAFPTPLIQKALYPPISRCKGLTHGHSRIQLCAMHADNEPPTTDGNPRAASAQNDALKEVQDAPAMDPWEELEAEAARWRARAETLAAAMVMSVADGSRRDVVAIRPAGPPEVLSARSGSAP